MIHLVTDSTAYLPPEIKEKYGIHTISLKVSFGSDQTCDEDGGITKDEFYRLLANVATAPTTSQPSAGEFIALYEQLVGEEDEVISIHISEGLSGTIPNAAAAAAEVAPDRIHIVDSRTAAAGLMLLVITAAEALAAGKSCTQVVAMLERLVKESCSYFMVENLEYLHKGGRINTASRFLGTLLNIKPILHMHEGKIEALDKTRTSKKARARVLDEAAAFVGQRPVRAAVAHIQALEAAQEMVELVRERLNCVSLDISEVGPVIGTHVGPGFLGVVACPVEEENQ